MIALGLNHLSTLNCSRNCPSLLIISLKSMAIQMVDGPTTYSHFRVRFFGPVLPRLSSAGHRDGGVCAELHWGGEVLSGPVLGGESSRKRSSRNVMVTETSASPVVL